MTELTSRPLRVFLCHSSGDKPTVRELYRQLNVEGWIDVWLDEAKLFPGHDWNLEIEKAVEAADVILVCISNNSITKEGYIQRELRIVLDYADYKPEGTLFIIPVRLEECEPPRRLRRWQYVDYFPKAKRKIAFQRLLESLKVRASELGLLTAHPKKSESPVSSVLPKRTVPKPVKTDPKVSPKLTPSTTPTLAKARIDSIWMYGRLIVLFLLTLGFLGPWEIEKTVESVSSHVKSFSEVIREPYLTIMPLATIGLSLITLMRLLRWRLGAHQAIVRLEALGVGIASISVVSFVLQIVIFPWSLGWGLWAALAGIYVASFNIIFETRYTFLEKGQKLPRSTWLLGFTNFLPWLLAGLLILRGLLSN